MPWRDGGRSGCFVSPVLYKREGFDLLSRIHRSVPTSRSTTRRASDFSIQHLTCDFRALAQGASFSVPFGIEAVGASSDERVSGVQVGGSRCGGPVSVGVISVREGFDMTNLIEDNGDCGSCSEPLVIVEGRLVCSSQVHQCQLCPRDVAGESELCRACLEVAVPIAKVA